MDPNQSETPGHIEVAAAGARFKDVDAFYDDLPETRDENDPSASTETTTT